MNKTMLFLFLLLFAKIFAQTNILDNYITEGLENNLALKQKQFSLNKSMSALDEARGLLFPSISINARYSKAGGGRTIDLPIGDLVNPIYNGLNSIVGQQVYPTNIPNQSVNFLRETEHETKISLVQPIFKPEIYFNQSIKSDLTLIEKSQRDSYARELIKEIKKSYYNYLKTIKIVELYDSTEILVEENLRISKVLYENDKVTVDVVYRAETELSTINEEKAEALKNNDLAKSYFNFLLNRALDERIEIEESIYFEEVIANHDDEFLNSAISKREELKQISTAIKVSESTIKLNKSAYLPGLVVAVDYGFQGEEYKFTKEDDFWMASLVLQWNLFNGFQDNAKIEQSEWNKKQLEAQKTEVQKSIMLQVREVLQNLKVTKEKLTTSKYRKQTAEESFKIISKKFANGMASQIELTDARTTLTQAAISEIVNRYDYLINLAELERVSAEFDLPFYQNENKL